MFATITNKQKSTVFSIIVFVLFFYGFLSAPPPFLVKDYGATGNNQNDHQAIQSAIDACSNAEAGLFFSRRRICYRYPGIKK